MNPPASDWRKTRSRQYLIDALLTLMAQKYFEKISIQEIVQTAHVSRSTFYAQFEDKYHFLSQICDDILADLRSEVLPSAQGRNTLQQESHQYYQRHFEFIHQHARFFQTMLGPHGTWQFRQKLEQSAYLTYQTIFLEFSCQRLPFSLEYLIQYIVSAHIGITLRWIAGGMQEPPSAMAQNLTSLTFDGLLRGLNLDSKVALPK